MPDAGKAAAVLGTDVDIVIGDFGEPAPVEAGCKKAGTSHLRMCVPRIEPQPGWGLEVKVT